MTLPLPVHVAASGAEMLIWLIVGIIWLVFQGLAAANKKKSPPDDETRPTPSPRRDEVQGDELRELIETLTGRKPPMQADEDEEEEPPALPRPAPKPVVVRKVTLPPPRVVQAQRRAGAPVPPPVPAPPPVPQPVVEPVPVMDAHLVFAQAAMTREALRLAPLLKMKWPRSEFQRLGGAAKRTSTATRLKRQLLGHAALRQAMVSRIVLGPPGGR
jgi:hypothetical protein